MNKFLIRFSLLSLFIFTHCKSIDNNITITQKEASQEIILRTAKDVKNYVIRIQFPKEIIISNNSLYTFDILSLHYMYNNIPSNRNLDLGLYITENDTLKMIMNNKSKLIFPKKELRFIIYSRHFVDDTKSIQEEFKPYIQKMLAQNKDTLHIGTVQEFKKKHKKLFELFTKNDSLSIQFLEKYKFGELITIPLKW